MPVRDGIDEAGEEAARTGRAEARDLVQHEQLIERAVVERAGERLLVVVGAVGVIDRHRDEALARQVLAEVAHQIAVAGIAVRDDHERERPAGGQRRGVAHGPAVERGGHAGVARDRAVLAAGLLARSQRRGIPDLERQRAVVAGRRPAFLGVQDVGPVLVGDAASCARRWRSAPYGASSGAVGVTMSMRLSCARPAARSPASARKGHEHQRIASTS